MKLLSFDLKKYNTSGISYKDDGQVPYSKIQDNKIINTASIPFTKPYKLQIRASKVIDSERSISKKTLVFSKDITLLDALKDAQKAYEQMMLDLENGKHKKTVHEITEDTPFEIAWAEYLEYKVSQYNSLENRNAFDTVSAQQFYNKWLKPLSKKSLNRITVKDINDIKGSMKHKNGTPLAERTRRWVHQHVNPVYSYVNALPHIATLIKSPASTRGLPPLDNERELEIDLEEISPLFLKIRDYPLTPYREIFMWLMHGRRVSEVLKLKWEDIDLVNDNYTIGMLSNKARVKMTYSLTKRLKATLEILAGADDLYKMKGYVFKSINDENKHIAIDTLRYHWTERIEAPIVLHNLRKCVTEYLKNRHEVSSEIVDYITGHKQKGMSARYGKFYYQILGKKLNLMLDEIFDDEFSPKIEIIIDDKLIALQKLFPSKSIEQLKAFLDD